MRVVKPAVKILNILLLLGILIVGIPLAFFNFPVALPNAEYELGVTFSNRYARDLGLDWKETYLAILDDLEVKKVRIPVYWDIAESSKNQYDFSDIDWQLEQANERAAEIILVVGQRVPRWPECFIPGWVASEEEKRRELLELIELAVERYKNNPAVKIWQVENEPFLSGFGECPPLDVKMLESEIEIVRQIDPSRPILLTDSGELSFWYRAAKRADKFGTTMYRVIHKSPLGYYTYPLGPNFFRAKHWFIETFANQSDVIVIELQAEPWASGWVTNVPLEEQFRSMNEEKLVEFVEYARRGGFTEIYLWGAEWWYWLKTQKQYPAVWETARGLFEEHTANIK